MSCMNGKVRIAIGALAALLAITALLPGANAASAAGFCNTAISNVPTVLSYPSALGSLLPVALMLILIMVTVVGITYALGAALKIDKLTRFSRTELGEILITALIVLIFIGTVSASNSTVSGPASVLHIAGNAFNSSIFYGACTRLTDTSLNLVYPLIEIGATYDLTDLLGNLAINLEPDMFGVSFNPLAGYSTLVGLLNILMSVTGALIAFSLGIVFFLSLIYSVFPIFLYLGIVLRTIPWTRAAGGAFLGMFLGFYVLFPLLLYFSLSVNSVALAAVSSVGLSSAVSQLTSQFSPFSPLAALANSGVQSITATYFISMFVQNVLEPSFYTVFALALSLIIAFDFAETVGDFLGAPSLSSKNTLKGLI